MMQGVVDKREGPCVVSYIPVMFMTREDLLEHINAHGKELLDIGTGQLSIIAARDFDCRVTCVDISQVAVEESRDDAADKGLSDRIRYERADGANLPFEDNSFDIAVSWNAMHHIPVERREMYVRELCRTARETVAIADFSRPKFERIHGDSDYDFVDFDLVEQMLADCGKVERLQGDEETDGVVVAVGDH